MSEQVQADSVQKPVCQAATTVRRATCLPMRVLYCTGGTQAPQAGICSIAPSAGLALAVSEYSK